MRAPKPVGLEGAAEGEEDGEGVIEEGAADGCADAEVEGFVEDDGDVDGFFELPEEGEFPGVLILELCCPSEITEFIGAQLW